MNRDARFQPTMRQLRAFAAVYHLPKVGAAAEPRSVTQSAVSVSLRQLEDGLGKRLFERTTRTLQRTQAAHEAIVLVERILRNAEALGAGMLERSQLRRGRVGVTIMPAAYSRAADPAKPVVRALTDPRVSRDICIVTRRGRGPSRRRCWRRSAPCSEPPVAGDVCWTVGP